MPAHRSDTWNSGSQPTATDHSFLSDQWWYYYRNQVQNKCNVLESSRDHSPTPSLSPTNRSLIAKFGNYCLSTQPCWSHWKHKAGSQQQPEVYQYPNFYPTYTPEPVSGHPLTSSKMQMQSMCRPVSWIIAWNKGVEKMGE